MDFRLTFFFCLFVTTIASAYPSKESLRDKRDVMESMKNAWNEVVKTLSDAGDAVVHVFKPTEKSIVNKMADGIHLFQPTEKSIVDKMADGIKGLTK